MHEYCPDICPEGLKKLTSYLSQGSQSSCRELLKEDSVPWRLLLRRLDNHAYMRVYP